MAYNPQSRESPLNMSCIQCLCLPFIYRTSTGKFNYFWNHKQEVEEEEEEMKEG